MKLGTKDSGFTLLEVLVALALFSLVVTLVYRLYGAMLAMPEAVSERLQADAQAAAVIERLERDLEGVYLGASGYFKGNTPRGGQPEPLLDFLSTAHVSFSPGTPGQRLALVRYHLLPSQTGDLLLERQDLAVRPGVASELDDGSSREQLGPPLEAFDIRFLDAGGVKPRAGRPFPVWEHPAIRMGDFRPLSGYP